MFGDLGVVMGVAVNSLAIDAFASGIFLGLVAGLCLGVVLGLGLGLKGR
jgi:hypothetical protein